MVGAVEKRMLRTGAHQVADIHCKSCQELLGWKYVRTLLNFALECFQIVPSKNHFARSEIDALLVFCCRKSLMRRIKSIRKVNSSSRRPRSRRLLVGSETNKDR
jgi:hypothetical protein